ncbi:MAG TPA: 3-hexulose-6-phosphate synthase [Planctomycetota bacterium]|nr:3-hexulose-6-phosphate synthase [Planctomycetota bacterium]
MTDAATSRLQLALDEANLAQALRVAREAVEGGVDWIEAGTPLIKSEGLDAVRRLRAAFPGVPVVADMKTMDAGRMETEMAAKAGASAVMVLGAASDGTVRDAVEAGRNHGVQVGVDLVGVADPVARAREVEAMGAAFVSVHCPIDDQMSGKDPFATLTAVAAAVGLPVSVAGGINSETAARAVSAGAATVVVGGAITKAENATEAARAIKRAMRTGEAVRTTLFKRVGADDLRALLMQVSTCNISDAMHRAGALRGILPVQPGLRMAGRAVTVRTYPGDWAKPVQAIEAAEEGDVLVIDACGQPPAVWGELAVESCLQRKLGGVVVDGAIRDVDAIRRLGFPAFASHWCPNAGEPRGLGQINVPVVVGGQAVAPGDWVVGDDSGVVVLPAARAVEIANRSMDVFERENRLRKEIRAASSLAQVMELLRWEKK